jgi:small ligand-binding sensory domain FIST
VSVKVGAGLSTEHDPLEAGQAAAQAASGELAGAPVDLAVVFASGVHLAAPEAALEAVHSVLEPTTLVGCGAGGVLGGGRELESGTALAVWAAAFGDGGRAIPFHVTGGLGASGGELEGLPAMEPCSGAIVLSDPYSFPTDAVLVHLARETPTVPVLGGIASARTPEGEAALFLGDEVLTDGAVGVALEGVDVRPCVSQGAAPLGREVTITAGEGNLIRELAGRPALQMVELLISELPPRERRLVAAGLLMGIVIDPGKPEYGQGDFLVRGVVGADPETGSLAVGTTIEPGQVVRLHARDARSADEDLRRVLRLQIASLGGRAPVGALVFSCNGRGRAMFGEPDHDAAVVERELAGAPAAGFFAAGEIGPVGSRSYLHGFTATVALFAG